MITGINHITFSVKDLHASLAFYRDLLGMTLQVSWDAGAYLTAGDAWICLSLGHTSSADDYTHIAFSSREEGFDQLRGRLRAAGIQEWKVNTSEGDSLYVLDPDGHRLELHCGTLASRLADMRRSPYPGTLFAEESQ
ncbi:MAG: fosfomycin resistance glutathione transferase [Pseudomonadaceae bacterium]|nr:fosfomycin resistance glutathione transferase [Pseudomonadaceae bacterium]NLC00937.1 fosfomycin resistance glutathione transferase [Halopseudomonas formosensis]